MRFIHTADWQLGLKLHFVAGDAGARARAQRFDTVRRIAELAQRERVDAVLVAGDVFDDNAVGSDTLQQARDALAAFAPIPVLLLPGNHDCAEPGCVLARLAAGDHVRCVLDRTPVAVAGAIVYPCPLLRRQSRDDPSAQLPSRAAGEGIRIALAHGGVRDFGSEQEAPNRIDVAAVLARGFDYLALGDWHGLHRAAARAWYPGAPEATRFKEKDPGHVLLVEIATAGAEPTVTPIPVARTRWLRHRLECANVTDIERCRQWFEALPERSWTLLELELAGSLPLSARAELDVLLETMAASLLHLRVDDAALAVVPDGDGAARLALEGVLAAAAEALAAEDSASARAALGLLYRLVQQAEQAP